MQPLPLDEETLFSSFFGKESSSELESPSYLESPSTGFEDLFAESETPNGVPQEPLLPLLYLSSFQTVPAVQTDLVVYSPGSGEEEEEELVTTQSKKKTTQKKRNSSTNQKQSKRPPKKQKVESEFIRSLHGLTSDQLVEYEQTHNLTPDQQRELKNWTRKIRNRESALLSRQRKKTYQEELEQRIEYLKKENSRLERETIKLEAQNSVLKSEFLEFQKMISSSTFLSKMFSQKVQSSRLQNISSSYPRQNAVLQNAATPVNDLRLQYDSVLQNIASAGVPAALDVNKMTKARLDASALLYLCIMLHSYAQYYASLPNKPLLESESNALPITVQ